MSPLIAIAITTGILSAVWGGLAAALGLISWVGFLGCTSYFASSGGYKALLQTLLCNATGMLWALLLIHGEGWWGAGMAGYLGDQHIVTIFLQHEGGIAGIGIAFTVHGRQLQGAATVAEFADLRLQAILQTLLTFTHAFTSS